MDLTVNCDSSMSPIVLLVLLNNHVSFEGWSFFHPSRCFSVLHWYICYIVICWFMQKYTYIYWIHTDAMIITQEDFFNKICTSHFIARVRKGLLKVCVWEGVGDRTETSIFWPPLLWPATLCLSRSPDAQPEALGSTLLGAGFPYHISSITPSPTVTTTRTVLTSVLTELYNSSTPTRSPTRSLKLHVWSSSSGNNCRGVHRSLSSGASVYESIMGFFSLSHFVSQYPPTRFPLLTAIGMCHFLPVHHLEWQFGPGRRSKYNIFIVKIFSGVLLLNLFFFFIDNWS